MSRCIECAGEVVDGVCENCGLAPEAAELSLRRRLLYGLALFLLGAVAFLPTVNFFPPLDLDFMLIFLGVIFFTVMGLSFWLDRLARRRSTHHPLKRVLYGLYATPWILTLALFANGFLDTSPPTRHTTRVVGKFTMPGSLKNSRLVVPSWRLNRKIERIPIHRETYSLFSSGELVEIHVRDGAIGIPWCESVLHK
jgi:hypothetical protein